ncbi:MAG: tripartite tricarboxylate transporter substrate binding protein [Chloroflexi bacterium]|nr:tripartite tricarboxylate transporter substrate binding protein [Chloroflexota bacterium]
MANRTIARREFLKLGAGVVALSALGGSLSACASSAPAFPTKPINLIVPLAAGGAPDATFRFLADQMEKDLGQKVVVVNRPGPGGTVGVAETMQAKPDGYTVGMCAVAMLTVQPLLQDVPYKGPDDGAVLGQAEFAPMVLYVNAKGQYKTLQELLDAAQKNPGKVTLASGGGLYNIPHVEMALLEQLAGVKFNIVPYGSNDHVPAVLGGTIDGAVGQVALLTQHIQAGNARGLVVFGPGRASGLPDIATAKEQNYNITDIPYEFLLAPKGLPKEISDRLAASFKKGVDSTAFKDYCDKTGLIRQYETPDALMKKLKDDAVRHKKIVDDLGWAAKK